MLYERCVMTFKEVLKIQEVLGKKSPVDMNEAWVYHSNSRDEWLDIMELDVIHAIRIIRKYIGTYQGEPE